MSKLRYIKSLLITNQLHQKVAQLSKRADFSLPDPTSQINNERRRNSIAAQNQSKPSLYDDIDGRKEMARAAAEAGAVKEVQREAEQKALDRQQMSNESASTLASKLVNQAPAGTGHFFKKVENDNRARMEAQNSKENINSSADFATEMERRNAANNQSAAAREMVQDVKNVTINPVKNWINSTFTSEGRAAAAEEAKLNATQEKSRGEVIDRAQKDLNSSIFASGPSYLPSLPSPGQIPLSPSPLSLTTPSSMLAGSSSPEAMQNEQARIGSNAQESQNREDVAQYEKSQADLAAIEPGGETSHPQTAQEETTSNTDPEIPKQDWLGENYGKVLGGAALLGGGALATYLALRKSPEDEEVDEYGRPLRRRRKMASRASGALGVYLAMTGN